MKGRLDRLGGLLVSAFGLAALFEDHEAREFALFDEHLLNDLGLGPSAGNPLAERIQAYRESRRQAMARLGLI